MTIDWTRIHGYVPTTLGILRRTERPGYALANSQTLSFKRQGVASIIPLT